MAIIQVPRNTSFNEWRLATESLSITIGDVALLPAANGGDTFSTTSLVGSLTDVISKKFSKLGGSISGAVSIGGTLDVTGASTIASLNMSGNLAIATNKFTVASATGNTVVAGTLNVSGTITAAALSLSGDLAIATNKFTVASATGNTVVAGTLNVSGNASLAGITMTNKLTLPGANASISGSVNIPITSSGNTPVSGDFYATASGTLFFHNGTSVKTLAFTDSNITGNAANVTGIISIANGGTGRSTVGTANQVLGVNSGASGLEYKTITNGSGIIITHGANSITIATDGSLPSGSSTDTTFRVGQNLLVGSWNGSSHNAAVTGNALDVRPGSGVTITNLIRVASDTAGTNTVFTLNASGDITIGTNKVLVSASSGNTSIAGTLNVSGISTLDNNVVLGTTVGRVVSIGPNTDIITYTLTTTTIAAGQVVAAIPVSTYKSAMFNIQAVDSIGGKYHIATVLAVNNGSSLSNFTEYAATSVVDVCGVFSVDISTGNMRLLVTPTSTNSTVFKVTATLTK